MLSPSKRRERRGERGSAIIEAAFVTPVFFLLIFAVLEFGFLFRNYLTLTNTAAEGARAASVGGNDEDADYLTLRSVEHGFAAWDVENLDFVVIFHADGPDSQVPDVCKLGPLSRSGGSVDECNYFTPAEFNLAFRDAAGDRTPYWGCGTGSVDEHWCPIDRQVSLSATDATYPPGPSYVGVYVEATHNYITGFIGESKVLSATRIIRIEPERQ